MGVRNVELALAGKLHNGLAFNDHNHTSNVKKEGTIEAGSNPFSKATLISLAKESFNLSSYELRKVVESVNPCVQVDK